jgi:HEAT repeat protein
MSFLQNLFRPDIQKLQASRNIPGLIQALSHSDVVVRRGAVLALKEIGDARTVEPLIATLWDEDWNVRCYVIQALGKLGNARAIPSLTTLLQSDQQSESREAVAALGQIGASAVDVLIATLTHTDETLREAAAQALGEIGDARAVQPLIASFQDKSVIVRIAAREALGKIKSSQVETFIPLLRSSNAKVAASALDRAGWKPDVDETGIYYWIAKRKWQRCIAAGALAVEPLIAAFGFLQYDDENAAGVATALGKIGDPRAVQPLIEAFQSGLGELAQAAAEALVEIGDPRAIQPLIDALQDTSHCQAAARALVLFYHQGHLADATRLAILAQRDAILAPHTDYHPCGAGGHDDRGIGVDFPL